MNLEITVKNSEIDELFDRDVKKFKKIVNKSDILQEVRDRQYFKTTREKRRLKRDRNAKRK